MAREITGKDQRLGEKGGRRPWGLEQGRVVAVNKAWNFVILV